MITCLALLLLQYRNAITVTMPPHVRLEAPSPLPREPVSQEIVQYWKEKLASPPYLALPTDYPRISNQVCSVGAAPKWKSAFFPSMVLNINFQIGH
jgi:hypothetical protein